MHIYKAIHTAIKAHEGQIRKLDQDIYVAHPIEVGLILAKNNLSDEVIISGILHDTVEDTPLTLDEIELAFGPIVRLYVDYCSECDKSETWRNRKLNYLSRLRTAPIDVLFIVCVDKLTNIKSIYRNLNSLGEQLWNRFNAGYEDQKWYYYEILNLLSPIADHPLYSELEKQIRLVFNH